jgi:formamidopyrimidine-DNA glycosylase
MPELPEVETMVRGIRGDCTDRTIDHVEFVRIRKRPICVSPTRSAVLKATTGRVITTVSRLAKRILLQLDSGSVLVIEPRMTGLLLLSEPPTTEHRRIVWHFQEQKGKASSLEFWDRRGLGTISLLDPESLQALQSRLGPDSLQITVDQWKERLRATSREIKVALLDQQLVAGIGNLYASEILHRAHISPLRSAASLTNLQIKRLGEATQQVLNEAILHEGSTLSDGTYRNALNKDGSYQNQHRVYQRAGERCASCAKGLIQRIVQAQRATFFCTHCQR